MFVTLQTQFWCKELSHPATDRLISERKSSLITNHVLFCWFSPSLICTLMCTNTLSILMQKPCTNLPDTSWPSLTCSETVTNTVNLYTNVRFIIMTHFLGVTEDQGGSNLRKMDIWANTWYWRGHVMVGLTGFALTQTNQNLVLLRRRALRSWEGTWKCPSPVAPCLPTVPQLLHVHLQLPGDDVIISVFCYDNIGLGQLFASGFSLWTIMRCHTKVILWRSRFVWKLCEVKEEVVPAQNENTV